MFRIWLRNLWQHLRRIPKKRKFCTKFRFPTIRLNIESGRNENHDVEEDLCESGGTRMRMDPACFIHTIGANLRCEKKVWKKRASERRTCVIFGSLFLHFQSSPFSCVVAGSWWGHPYPLNCIVSILNHAKIRSSIICYNDQMIDRSKRLYAETFFSALKKKAPGSFSI